MQDFVLLLKKGSRIDDARVKARVGTRISRASASLGMTKNGKPTSYIKQMQAEQAAALLINESTRLRIKYEKINHSKTGDDGITLFDQRAKGPHKAVEEILSKHKPNTWFRLHGGMKKLAEKYFTSADEIKRAGNIKTNGMRGEHALIYIDMPETETQKIESNDGQQPEAQQLTEDKCVAFLKSLGYKVMKPVSEWVEI